MIVYPNIIFALVRSRVCGLAHRLDPRRWQSPTVETEAPTTNTTPPPEAGDRVTQTPGRSENKMTLNEQLDQARAARVEAARRELREIVARANQPQPGDGERLLGLADVLNIKPERVTAMLAAAGEIAALTWHRSRMLAEVPADHAGITRELIKQAEALEAQAKQLRSEAHQIDIKAAQLTQGAESHQARIDQLKTRYPEAF